MAKILAALLLLSPLVTSDLLGLPTVPFVEDGGHFDLSELGRIVVDVQHCDSTDDTGHTLIPPTLLEFANTFASDLESTGCHTEVVAGDHAEDGSIFLTIGNSSEFVDAAGRWTAEAYTLNVTDDRIIITGASPLGAWWATRSVFQQRALNGTIATGYGVDAPGWGTRGIMVRLPCPGAQAPLGNKTHGSLLISPARLWPSLLPARVPRRTLHLAIVLEAEHLPHPPV